VYPEAIGLLGVIRDSRCGPSLFRDLIPKGEMVKMKEKMGIGLGCMALLLLAMICVPVSASEQAVTSDAATCALIDELWGQDISIGEYFEQVHPEFLVDMPDDVRSKIYQQKMNWPETAAADENNLVERFRTLSDPFISCTAYMSMEYYQNNPYAIRFGGTTRTSEVVPYLYIEVYLKRVDTDETVSNTAHSVRNAAYDDAENLRPYPPPGVEYCTYVTSYCLDQYSNEHNAEHNTEAKRYPW